MCLQKLSFEKNVRFVNQQFIQKLKNERLKTLAKKYLFPALVIITGLCYFMGIVLILKLEFPKFSFDWWFNTTSWCFNSSICRGHYQSRKIQIGLYLALLLPMCFLLTNALYSSINTTIEEIETKTKDILIKQALNDIKDIELEYRKNTAGFLVISMS